MIVGKLNQFSLKRVPAIFAQALDVLANTNFIEKKVGVYEIDGDNLLYHVQEYETFNRDEVDAESHKNYCDIQYMVLGEEAIGWAPYDELQNITIPYNAENDITMITPPANETFITMQKDFFAFFAPEDIHRPRLNLTHTTSVKKVVVKIKVDALESR